MRVLLLPGAVAPAEPAYGDLEAALGEDVEVVAKDLELYRGEVPPEDYSLATEVEGARTEADERGWDRFHLVGYSAGGAVALAFAAHDPERLLSLALLEPAWAGSWDWSAQHAALWAAYEEVGQLPPEQRMRAFMRLQVRPDVALPRPPSGPGPL